MRFPAQEVHMSPARLLRAIGSYFLHEPQTFTFVATDTNYIRQTEGQISRQISVAQMTTIM